MINLRDIRYIRLGTQDLDACAKYATKILGLEPAGRDADALYFRGDSRDHTIVYFKGEAMDHTAAFEVDDKTELDAAGGALDALGHKVSWGTADGCAQRRVAAFITFKDPSGNKIDLVTKAHVSGRRYFGSRDAGITSFSHIGLKTTNAPRDEKFWTGVCSAKVSDWIGDAPLLRIDEVHHKIALFPSKVHGVQHINHQVQGIDDIMRSYYFLKEQGVRIVFGPGRHPTSGAMFLYFEGPDGMVYEYSTGVRTITREQEADYRPRQFPFNFESFCMWGSKPDIAEFRS